jgi:RIO kinase 1
VLDPRTLIILHKMINNKVMSQIYGCVSTGKEANVYYSYREPTEEMPEEAEFALKIFKTSILIFKDRERYVNGEFRFRKGYCKSNPRKMVTMWAEKEVRNLRRMKQAGIPCPQPHYQKNNIILMEFIGKNGLAAPRLRDAHLDSE